MPDPLDELRLRQGAVFEDGGPGGGRIALDFGDPAAEYEAAHHSAAVFDFTQRTQMELTGGDRVRFLHNFCTNDIKRLEPGTGCEAFVTNVKGRVLGHVLVFSAPDSIWIESVPGAEEPLRQHFGRYILTDDVTIQGRTAEFGELFVSGPTSGESLSGLGILPKALAPFEHAPVDTLEFPCFVRRVDILGTAGYLLSVPRGSLAALWEKLTSAIKPAGSRAFEALRIEAGFPVYGRDISDEHLAQEVARTAQAISFTKGCYLGQEPIARLDALGHTNRELRGMRLADATVPEPGSPVLSSEKDEEIGRVTSSAVSFRDGCGVALGYLRKHFLIPGTAVRVSTAGNVVEARVFWPGA